MLQIYLRMILIQERKKQVIILHKEDIQTANCQRTAYVDQRCNQNS
jgi:hypothetical protein